VSYRFTAEKIGPYLEKEAPSSPFLEPLLWPHFGACSNSTSMTQQAG